jgi:acyl carrier protein
MYHPSQGPRMDDISTRIIALIARQKAIPVESISESSTFDELNVDSLDKINLSFEVEETFAIEIPDASLNSLRTVADVVSGVEALLAAKAEAASASEAG